MALVNNEKIASDEVEIANTLNNFFSSFFSSLTLSWRRSLSYRNHSIDLQSKSMDWILYDGDLRHERVKNLKIPEYYVHDKPPHSLSRYPTLKAVLKYKNHPSIRTIKSFYFLQIDKNTVLEEIRKLNMNKAVQDADISVKILKENCKYFAEYMSHHFNEAICASIIPASFKFANVTPIFKQGSTNQKDNYRPISMLPITSKIFEKLICR